MSYRRSTRVATAWVMLALVGAGLQVVSILHTCESTVPTPLPAWADGVRLVSDHADAADVDCVSCVLSSHVRSVFTTGDVAILPPAPDGLVQPVVHAIRADARFRDLSARSPPTSA